jgi:hypothetical protein
VIEEKISMSLWSTPLLLLVLTTSPLAAQVQSVKAAPAPVPAKSSGGVQSAEAPLNPQEIAAMRAHFELAKANGMLCPERMARQEARLLALEAKLAKQLSQGMPIKGQGGVSAGVKSGGAQQGLGGAPK